MKRFLFTIACCAIAIMANAQFKVTSDGNVYIQDSYLDGHTMLGVGNSPYPYVVAGDFESYRMGIHADRYCTYTSKDVVGIYGNGRQSTSVNHGIALGVWGTAAGSSQNFGVVGGLGSSGDGAGIYGSTVSYPGLAINGTYAGYFDGPTYVDGALTATSIYYPSDIRLKENVSLLSEALNGKGSVLDNLLSLNVIEYDLKLPSRAKLANRGKTASEPSPKPTDHHYGISAQELQKIYPELVMEGQDGYLAVNYTELVPILIRSIQELKGLLEDLKRDELSVSGMSDNTLPNVQEKQGYLYQNTPNPFRENTIIRFSLPIRTSTAFICVFDMNGKMVKQIPVNNTMQSITINGYELQAGMYIYSLIVGGKEMDTKRMIMLN